MTLYVAFLKNEFGSPRPEFYSGGDHAMGARLSCDDLYAICQNGPLRTETLTPEVVQAMYGDMADAYSSTHPQPIAPGQGAKRGEPKR